MDMIASIRNALVPIHRAGYPFIAGFFVASILLGLLWEPLFWMGLVLTVWCAYFFRDPERVTPVADHLVVSPADGRVSLVGHVVPPAELGLGNEPLLRVSIFMNVFNCHVNRVPVRGRIARIAYKEGKFANAELDKASEAYRPVPPPATPTSSRAGQHLAQTARSPAAIDHTFGNRLGINAGACRNRRYAPAIRICPDASNNPHLSRGNQTLKLLPHPQVVFALGLRMTNWAPVRLSV